ncbi:MAG: hypothetical protein ACTHLE_14990 [Agriterribacter sp.]
MKKFIRNVSLFSLLVIVMLVSLSSYRVYKVKNMNWKLPENIHVLFMGASHIECGINDSIFPNSINLAMGSERYMFTYLKLRELLKYNPQVDRVYLQYAPTDTWKNTDSKYYSNNEMSYFLPTYLPLFSKEEWKVYDTIAKSHITTLLTQKIIKRIPSDLRSLGCFKAREEAFDSRKDSYKMPEWQESGSQVNLSYLEKIVKLCKDKNIRLYFLYMPMFNPAKFYDQEAFYKTYREKFSDITLLDYSAWKCPDSWRADEHHLNYEGASNFTKELYSNLKGK